MASSAAIPRAGRRHRRCRLLLVLLTAFGLILQRSYLDRRSHITVGGRGLRLETVQLGRWKWALLAFCVAVVFLAALAPVGVLAIASFSRSWVNGISLGNFTLGNFDEALFNNQIAVRGILNSFRLAAAAGVCAMIIGGAVAYVDLRTQAKGRRLLDYLAILPLGLPGTVMAVGVLLAFIRPPFAIYGTMWILLVAYVARFVPLAARSANATLRQIDPSLEEAARISGASRLASLWHILLPLARPGLAVAFLLVFIPALSELSATILLYSGGTETISVAIFRLNDLGQLEVVAALAVFTIVVTLLVSLPLNRLSNREPDRPCRRRAGGLEARHGAYRDRGAEQEFRRLPGAAGHRHRHRGEGVRHASRALRLRQDDDPAPDRRLSDARRRLDHRRRRGAVLAGAAACRRSGGAWAWCSRTTPCGRTCRCWRTSPSVSATPDSTAPGRRRGSIRFWRRSAWKAWRTAIRRS